MLKYRLVDQAVPAMWRTAEAGLAVRKCTDDARAPPDLARMRSRGLLCGLCRQCSSGQQCSQAILPSFTLDCAADNQGTALA